MLETLTLKNFKPWREVKALRFSRITGLFGANSSGKSSLLQLLLMLKQTAAATDRSLPLELGDDRSLVELGTFKDIMHGHDTSKELEWALTWKLPESLKIDDPVGKGKILFQGERLTHSARIAWSEGTTAITGRIVIRRHTYTFGDREFGMELKVGKKNEYGLIPKDDKSFRFNRAPGRPWPLPAPSKSYGFPDHVRGYFQNAAFLSDFELAFETLFASMFYLGPLRETPRREYAWSGGQPSDMGRKGEKVVDALLASRDRGTTISQGRGKPRLTVEARIAAWLKKLKLIHSFEVRPIADGSKLYEVVVRKTSASPPVLITDVGFGVSQILPVLTLCYYAPEGSILVLEQPEIHLHPSVQSGLADVFIDVAQTRNVQIILESHSEHLLRRLQRRIAEGTLRLEDTSLFFCESTKTESKISELELDPFGSIKNWPSDFFGDEFGEIAATQEAIVDRQLKGSGA